LKSIKADPGQIEQVIMNLAVNARDAMPKGGELSIQTANCVLEGTDNRQVLLVLTDTGAGMDVPTQARIFEPFFTTKGPGEGTGLGLATVYGIVEQSGGRIGVESQLGRGSSFKIHFPAVDGASDLTAQPVPTKHSQGCETLLVVEDEDSVRKLVCGVLEHSGYTVLMARNGSEALLLCEKYADRIDLLITDMVMPSMNGTELADRLSAIRRDIKVLFISGYSDNAIAKHGHLAPDTVFLQKPFHPNELTRRVREMLDSQHRLG
jgi:two-component system cell cycle sensor histidine kinase/response regulator CckA